MIMDLSSIVDSFSDVYTVTRLSPSSYGTDGRLVAATTSTFNINACVQPTSGRDLQRLPEGLRTQQILAIFTASELKTQGAGQDPDQISISGDAYEIQTVEPWDVLGNYFKALALRIGS